MQNDLPKRKQIRLADFDYSTNGAYFVTVCTKNRRNLFGPVGASSVSARMITKTFLNTIKSFPAVESPIFVVMPNHFHAIMVISRLEGVASPSLADVMKSFKIQSTLEYIKLVKSGIVPSFDGQIWQRSYYDHVIRNQHDYEEIYRYIYENPLKWELDKLYSNE